MLHKTGSFRSLLSVTILPFILAGCLLNDPVEGDITVALAPPTGNNAAPDISGSPPRMVKVGVSYSFQPDASDADADPLSFIIRNRPSWANFDASTGEISGVPLLGSEGTYDEIAISVTDGAMSTALPNFSITVESSTAPNMPPEISGDPQSNVTAGNSYSFRPSSSDPDGDALTFSVENMPEWASFNDSNGRLRGTPTSNDVGEYSGISISVSDGTTNTSLPSFTITVNAMNSPPEISGSPATRVTAGSAYVFTPSASDADGDTLAFTVQNAPSWTSFDTDTGTLTGTPEMGDVDTYAGIRITVSDGQAEDSLSAFSIEVSADNSAPTISGSPAASVTVGNAYAFTPVANDADGDTLTFAINNKPEWASFDTASGQLAGTPEAGDAGSYAGIEISVSDGQASAQLSAFSIQVNAASGNSAPVISGNPSNRVTANTAYSFTPTASDADAGDTLTFAISGQPSWAAFDTANGRLSGTPVDGDAGTYSDIAISVSDGTDTAALAAFAIEVNTQPPPPPPPSGDWPVAIPVPGFDFEKQPGPVTMNGTLPGSLGAGEVLQLSDTNYGDDVTFSCNGTASNPTFILGGKISGANDQFNIAGSHCYFVGTEFVNIYVRPSGDHQVYRDINQHDNSSKNGFSIQGSSYNVVIIDSEIHHNQGDDRHGIHVSRGAENIWVLRNHIHHNGGDGFQACHQCEANPPKNVYIGQNVFHSDRENGIDFKYLENVVVSENTVYGYRQAGDGEYWCFDDGSKCSSNWTSGSDGAAIVIGSDGGPVNVLVINNEVYDSRHATRIEKGTEIVITGNNFHEINGRCLSLEKEGFNTIFDGNTCTNAQRGVHQFWRDKFSIDMTNNVFRNISEAAIEFETNSVIEASSLEANTFDNAGPVIYNNDVANTAAEINALPNSNNNIVQ